MSIDYLRFSHGGGGGEADKNQVPNTILKIVSIVSILGLTVAFGLFPLYW